MPLAFSEASNIFNFVIAKITEISNLRVLFQTWQLIFGCFSISYNLYRKFRGYFQYSSKFCSRENTLTSKLFIDAHCNV